MSTNNSPFVPFPLLKRTRWLIAAGLAGVVLSACGGSSSSSSTTAASSAAGAAALPSHLLNTKRVALAIEQSIFTERKLHSKVTCPPAVPQQKGRTFSCVAATHSHKRSVKTVFTVFQKDGAGQVYYASPK